MKKPFSNTEQYIAQLKSITQQINQNQLPEAVQQLNLLVKTNPNDPRLFLLGSRLAEVARNPEGMLQAARRAHQLAPDWPMAILHLAAVLASRDEAEEALALAQQVVGQGAENTAELLTKAAAVAQRLNHHAQALQWLRQAEQVGPGDFTVRTQIARTLAHSGDVAEAIAMLTDLLLQLPGNPTLLSDRLRACVLARNTEQAILDGEALLTLEPGNAQYKFYLDIARGLSPISVPALPVSGLFGGYAARPDYYLVLLMQIETPREVARMILQWHPDRAGDVLDIGCGAGLLGAHLGPIQGVLVGVEQSSEMTELASRMGVYDRIHRVEALDALRATPGNLYHVIAALDLPMYLGSLDAALPDAHRILLPGGRLVFTCEIGVEGGADYVMQANFRFRHQLSYVQRLLETIGFEDISMAERVIGYEAGQPVRSLLVTARKAMQVA